MLIYLTGKPYTLSWIFSPTTPTSETAQMPRLGRPPTHAAILESTQREIVWWLAKGLSREEVARRVGLPSADRLHHFARTKEFANELRLALSDYMATELAPKAVAIMDEIMSDKNVSPRVRVEAGKTILDRSGYSARAIDPNAGVAGDLSELTAEQLRVLVATAEAEQESKRLEENTIEGTAVQTAEGDDVGDLLD